MPDIRVAVIGCGAMGGIHLARWSEVSGAQIVAVCDSDPVAATRAATEYAVEAHLEWQGLIAGLEVDVLDICTPPNSHAEIAIKGLQCGKHILCEKPLARGVEEARRIAAAAAESTGKLMPAFCHRFHPPILFAKELIENDDLGRIVMFRSRFSGSFSGVDHAWFSDPEIAGGGALLDTAVHSVDLFRYLVGEVAFATGRVATFNPRLSVEDSGIMALQAESGALGVVEASWSTPGGRNELELYGTAGACFVDYDSGQIRFKTADMAVWETREVTGPDRFQREILHFADAIRGLQPLMATGFDGVRANEIIDDVYRSASNTR